MGAAPAAETAALFERVLGGAVGEEKKARRTHNLPRPFSSFVGRADEIAAVRALCGANRLVTLVGAGGVGKTRLALQVAADLRERFSDGAWFIDVTPVEDLPALLRAIAQALRLNVLEGEHLAERIADDLGDRPVLLVLDNCERAIAACAAFAQQTLSRCANVSILATSRQRLRVPGEVTYDVSPLCGDDALRLFSERAAASTAAFDLTAETRPFADAICERLDGIPLAIELAASRLRILSIAQVLERLEDRFTLLRGTAHGVAPHQQTLRATIDWSYALLDDEERRVLDRLAVFSGTCSLEAAAAVCARGTTIEVLDILEQLAEKSLIVVVRRPDANRYRLLDSVREYLLEKLAEQGALDDARALHLTYFVQLAEELEPQLTRAGQESAMNALTEERDNLRAAFSWPTANREHLALRLRLASALRWFYWFRGLFDLARERLAENLRAYGFERSEIYARAAATYGFFLLQQSDTRAAIEQLESALDACPEDGPQNERAMIELQLGMAQVFSGNESDGSAFVHHGLTRARRIGDPWLLSYALALEGVHMGLLGRRLESIELLREALSLSQQTGESFQGTFWLLNLAVQQYHVDPDASAALFMRCAEQAIADDNARAVAGCFEGLGWCLQSVAHFEASAELLGAAHELRVQTSQPLLPQWQLAHDAAMTAIHDPAVREATARAWDDGIGAVRARAIDRVYEVARSFLERALAQSAIAERPAPDVPEQTVDRR